MSHVKRLILLTCLIFSLSPGAVFGVHASSCVPRQPFAATSSLAYAAHLGDPPVTLSTTPRQVLATVTGCLSTVTRTLGPLQPAGFLVDQSLYLVTYQDGQASGLYLVHRGWEVVVLTADQWAFTLRVAGGPGAGVRLR